MKLLYNISFLFLIIYFITSCSQSIDKDNINQNNNENPEFYYSKAMIEFENENYDLALETFKDLELNFHCLVKLCNHKLCQPLLII